MKHPLKVFLVYGQGGKALSMPFVYFCSRLRRLGFDVNDSYNYKSYTALAREVYGLNAIDKPKIALLGYSMGAWAVAMACGYAIKVDLAVGYDMSGGWGPYTVSTPPPFGSNVKRVIHYEAGMGGDPFLSMKYQGKKVEHIKSWLPHALVQGSGSLHANTIAALQLLRE